MCLADYIYETKVILHRKTLYQFIILTSSFEIKLQGQYLKILYLDIVKYKIQVKLVLLGFKINNLIIILPHQNIIHLFAYNHLDALIEHH